MQEKDCLFCRIINGDIPSSKVYEDEFVYAFLDIAPGFPGHTLIVPKKHYKNILDMDAKETSHIFAAVQKIAPAMMKVTGAEGFHVLQNNNEAAGQTVFHTHFHVIPRKADDGMTLWTPTSYENKEKMLEMAQKIRNEIQ
jgi:histidine triad (HIT) family protein